MLGLSIGELELPVGLTDWALGISLAVLTFMGQTFITLALKYEQSVVVSLGKHMRKKFSYKILNAPFQNNLKLLLILLCNF